MLKPPTPSLGQSQIDTNRRALFGCIGDTLQRYADAQLQSVEKHARSLVWSHGVMMGVPRRDVARDGSHLLIEWEKGLSASIVVRLGECRIGLLIPRNQVPDGAAVSDFSPYPADSSKSQTGPFRIVRELGADQFLVDFVFVGIRLGDFELTRGALLGSAPDIAILADGIGQETMHLVSALVHHLAMAGVYFGDGLLSEQESRVFSAATPNVSGALNLTPAQLYPMGEGELPGTRKWMAVIPPGSIQDFEARLQALSHHEFMERQKIDSMCDVDGLTIHASSGVYHPLPGSSTIFLLDALSRDELFCTSSAPLRVLDLGCGTGAIALWVKRRHPHWMVSGSDKDVRAIDNSLENASRNHLQVAFVHADLLDIQDPARDTSVIYDRIIWNYPFWQVNGDSATDFEHIAIDENGDLLRRFFAQLPSRLTTPDGALYLSYSTLADQDLLLQLCQEARMDADLVLEEQVNGYRRQVWRIAHSPAPHI